MAYAEAYLTNAPADEFASDISDASGGAFLATSVATILSNTPLPSGVQGTVGNFVSKISPGVRSVGSKISSGPAVVLFSIIATIQGTCVYLSKTSKGAPSAGTFAGYQAAGYYFDGSTSVCTQFNSGPTICYTRHYN